MNELKAYRAIMLSSTFTDLKEHRQSAARAIEKFGYRANVMEYDGARADADVIESSLKMVRDSAAYICIISLKYGQTPFDPDRNPDRLSVTELEFNEAMQLSRPIVLFIMDEEHLVRKADIESDPGKLEKLNTFRERAKRMGDRSEVERVHEMFETLEQFSIAAAIAVGRLVQDLKQRETNERSPAPIAAAGATTPLRALSNIPINVPRHFLGRDEDLAAIDAALKLNDGRVAITALRGLRGVGKTTLAAAYAERHRSDYRATWWIRAQTDPTMRADLVALGVQLGWVAKDEKEDPALTAVMERLCKEGHGILLVYDNANNAAELRSYMPRSGSAQAIVTSNAPDWRGIAALVEIEVWSKEVGADYLIARAGRDGERDAALALSEALGGLPLAHEQAAAYCERLGISFANYLGRFEAAPAKLLDTAMDAPADYHDRMTVAKTFALAIDKAMEMHPAADLLISHAALLAPEPIPLYLFSEAREKFGETFASLLAGDGLDDAIAALRAFALIDREDIQDERNPTITTDCIRLHRLIRQVAAARYRVEDLEDAYRVLIIAMSDVYPSAVLSEAKSWPRARRLDAIALALVGRNSSFPAGTESAVSYILNQLAMYRQGALAAYAMARPLFERVLAMREKTLGRDHLETARSLNNLGFVIKAQGDLAGARGYYERALAIREKALSAEHPDLARSLNNLGAVLLAQSNLAAAQPHFERALAIREKTLGSDHWETAVSLSNLAALLNARGNLAGARALYKRALEITEKVRGPHHLETATSLSNFGQVLSEAGERSEAFPLFERALSICESVLGHNHPLVAVTLNNMGGLLDAQGDLSGARARYERALAIREMVCGPDHSDTAVSLHNLGGLLHKQGDFPGARLLHERALAILERALGPDHPDTALCLINLGGIFRAQGDLAGARPLHERALQIFEKVLGTAHPSTRAAAQNTAAIFNDLGLKKKANALHKKFGIKNRKIK